MTNRLWVFPAILCLLLTVTFLEQFSIVGFTLAIIWLIRIMLLKHVPIFKLSILVGMIFIGSLVWHHTTNNSILRPDQTSFIVLPKVTSVKVDGNQVRFNGWVQQGFSTEEVVVTHYVETKAEQQQWIKHPPNDYLIITGELVQPAPHSNFYQFNYQQYLRREKVHWLLDVGTVEIMRSKTPGKPIRYYIESIRYAILHEIEQVFEPTTASYLKTILFADKRNFSAETLKSYEAIGIIHLFSISGFHITYLVSFLRQVFLRLGMTHERVNILLLFILPMYGLVTGFGVSVFRALIQNMFLLGSKIFQKKLDTMDAWSLTMIFALIVNPYQIYKLSFQLSYILSGLFIVIGKQNWTHELSNFKQSFLYSLLSSLASLPILLYHFYEFPWITTFANILFIPIFSMLLFPFLFLLYISSFFLQHTTLFYLSERFFILIITFIEEATSLLANTYNFTIVTGRLPIILQLVLILSIFYCLKKIENKQFPKKRFYLILLGCLLYPSISPVGYVTMLDVGQGDSIVVKRPFTSKAILIDTGGRVQWRKTEDWMERQTPFSVGRNIIVPSLKALGISKIERLYVTHADADHSGEIKTIGTSMTIKEVVATTETLTDESVKKQLVALDTIQISAVTPPEILTLPNDQTIAMHPHQNFKGDSKNNNSLVLYVTMGNDNWLFTGDIEKEAEASFIQNYPFLPIDYLKVSHHGSESSTTNAFIQQLRPRTALISVGKNNTYGHPAEEVMETLLENRVETYLTSDSGAIMVKYIYVPIINYWWTDIHTVHKAR